MNKQLLTALLATTVSVSAQTITYDFNSQWNGDWQTYHTQTGGSSYSPSMNYSKSHEGRLGGAGGNTLGGTVSAPAGYQGQITSIYEGIPTRSLVNSTDRIRLQGSYSAFANQNAFQNTGVSEAGQVGIINAGSSNASKTLSGGDSVYLGFKELTWTGQNVSAPYPGTATLELGLYVDGVQQVSFGTYTAFDYGARISNGSIWAQWYEYDILFENLGNGDLGYKIGVNQVSHYYDGPTGSINEGAPVSIGTWQGSLGSNGGITNLSNLRAAYGTNIVNTDVTVTGFTFDHTQSGDLHDGVIVVPEPSSSLLAAFSSFLLLVRRKR